MRNSPDNLGMGQTIRATLPRDGFSGIQSGEVYEARLFSADDIARLVKVWRMRPGTIQDAAHRGVKVIQFIGPRLYDAAGAKVTIPESEGN